MSSKALVSLVVAVIVLAEKVHAVDLCSTLGYGNATATPDLTQGPFHITENPELFRSNVTEGQAGIPLQLEITVLDTACQTLPGVYVEIWHANFAGYYSGVEGQTPETGEPASSSANRNTTFLRGVAEVDAAGVVTFNTIVPGRYMGRAFHVHYAVHIPTNSSTSEVVEWDSAYVSHIGQIFFEDSIGDTVHQYPPYSTVSNASITYLGDDDVYTGDTNLIADYTPVDPDAFEAGAVATIQAIVDTSEVTTFVGDYGTTTAMGMDGGAGGPMPSGGMEGPGAGMGSAGGPMPAGGSGALPLGPMPATTATSVAGRRLQSLSWPALTERS